MKNKHILLEDIIYAIKKYFFTYLPIAKAEKNIIEKIILLIYKDNMQIKKKRFFCLL